MEEKAATIEWVEAQSDAIVRFGYEEKNQTLFVAFKKAGIYKYYDVPKQVFEDMKAAPSKGTFVAQELRGKYQSAKHLTEKPE